MGIKGLYGLLLGVLALLLSCGSNQNNDTLTIAVAANMQYAIDPLMEAFTASTGITCDKVVGSSGKLAAQIMEGAPFDVFLSADMRNPQELYIRKLTTDIPQLYASGKLILWSIKADSVPPVEQLTDSSIHFIAIANPALAPYGQAAREVLEHYGLSEKVKEKLVIGESIAQVNHYIVARSIDVGFTAKSSVFAPEMKYKGQWIEIDSSAYTPIRQGAVACKNAGEQAEAFLDFLKSDKAKKILTTFGYTVDE